MKISRRNFLKVLGSATMAGALAACGGDSFTHRHVLRPGPDVPRGATPHR